MSSCKVLHILNEDPLHPTGGLGVHVQELCAQLRLNPDFETTVLAVDYHNQEGGFFVVDTQERHVTQAQWKAGNGQYRLLKIFNTTEVNTHAGFIIKMITDDLFLESALRWLGRESFDIIHIHDSSLWRVARSLQALFAAPIVLTVHLSFFLAHPVIPESPFYMYDAQKEAAAMHGCNRLISVSRNYLKRLRNAYFLGDKGTTILNGVNYDFLKTVPYDEKAKSQYDKPLVVFLGRLVPTKGIDIVLKLIKALPQYHFALIASLAPTLEDRTPQVLEMRHMWKQGYQFDWHTNIPNDEKWELMKVADIAIMPSLHEPFGIVALEWMSLGVPLIVSGVDGLTEFCTDSNSVVIEPTVKAFTHALRTFKPNPGTIANGISTAKRLNWVRTAQETGSIYKELIYANRN